MSSTPSSRRRTTPCFVCIESDGIVGNFNARQQTSHARTLRNRRESQRFSAGYVGSELCLARKGSRIDRETLWDRSRTATAVRCRPPKSGIQPLDAGVAASWPYRATRMTSRRTPTNTGAITVKYGCHGDADGFAGCCAGQPLHARPRTSNTELRHATSARLLITLCGNGFSR